MDADGFDASADCDDSDPFVNPGMPEVCGDVLDNNCNGTVDEGCPEGRLLPWPAGDRHGERTADGSTRRGADAPRSHPSVECRALHG